MSNGIKLSSTLERLLWDGCSYTQYPFVVKAFSFSSTILLLYNSATAHWFLLWSESFFRLLNAHFAKFVVDWHLTTNWSQYSFLVELHVHLTKGLRHDRDHRWIEKRRKWKRLWISLGLNLRRSTENISPRNSAALLHSQNRLLEC